MKFSIHQTSVDKTKTAENGTNFQATKGHKLTAVCVLWLLALYTCLHTDRSELSTPFARFRFRVHSSSIRLGSPCCRSGYSGDRFPSATSL